MALYKYFPPQRVDVVARLEIRFTQPGALNDPFELRPRFETLFSQAELLEGLSSLPSTLGEMVPQAYAMLSEEQRAGFSLEDARRALQGFLATPEARASVASGLRALLPLFHAGASDLRDELYSLFDRNVGILSLTEKIDSTLMWSHYADSHRGFAVEFDELHSFFSRRRSESDEFYHLRSVVYTDSGPPESLSAVDCDSLFVTKGKQWEYEREWRMLAPLSDAARTIEIRDDVIHLFAYPADAITRVILGSRAETSTRKALREALKGIECRDVPVLQASLDVERSCVRVPRSTEDGA